MSSTLGFQISNAPTKHDPHHPSSGAGNVFLRAYRAVYRAFGFQKGYNFPLYAITVGTLCGFILARFQYLDFDGIFLKEAIPGEAYWYKDGHRRLGMILHLVGVLCGGFLACLQFTPVIRHKFIWLHRICGYLAIILFLMGNAGAFMILDHAVGGSPAFQVWIVVLGLATTVGLSLAWINIKRLQIDQHRAWMIRTWAWAANVITLRLILLAGIYVVPTYNIVLWSAIRCDEIHAMYASVGLPIEQNPTSQLYPTCGEDAASSTTAVAVSSMGEGPEAAAVMLRLVFVMSAWLALTIHALLAELYLWLTPAEHYRLRVVSYHRQVERGLTKPGRSKEAGLGSSRLGDAPEWWSLPLEDFQMAKTQPPDDRSKWTSTDYERRPIQHGIATHVQKDGTGDSEILLRSTQQ